MYKFRKIIVRSETDKFNWFNRLTHAADIGKLNRDGRKILKNSDTNIMDWKPESDYYCDQCIPEIVKSKIYNINPIRNIVLKKTLPPCLHNLIPNRGKPVTYKIYNSIFA